MLLDADVVTRRGPTVHEDIGEQLNRLNGELWKEYAEKLRVNDESTYRRNLHLLVLFHDDDHLSAPRALRSAWVRNTSSSTWCQLGEVIAEEPIELGPEFRVFHKYLDAWSDVVVAIATRATTQTSTLISFLQATPHGAAPRFEIPQLSHETDWTDEKNQRRCELVDKEIEGTLSPMEKIELEKLQTQMLAYRRKLAPLPLDELRELHRALLREAGDQSE